MTRISRNLLQVATVLTKFRLLWMKIVWNRRRLRKLWFC